MERTLSDRMHAIGPLVLRLGLAAVLAQHGLGLAGDLFDGRDSVQTLIPDAAAATIDGVRISAGWVTLMGIGELLTSGLLVLGLLTRIVVLPMIGMAAYGVVQGFPTAGLPTNQAAMLLVGAAGLSLLISGAGCLALTRPRPRVVMYEVPVMEEPRVRRRETDHVVSRPSLGRRLFAWLRSLRPKQTFTRPKRGWRPWPQRKKHMAW